MFKTRCGKEKAACKQPATAFTGGIKRLQASGHQMEGFIP